MLVAALALGGCTARPAVAPPPPQWWHGMGDAQLSLLIEQRLVPAPARASVGPSTAIAGQYIALRARQTALVLLARREEMDTQQLTMARRGLERDAKKWAPVFRLKSRENKDSRALCDSFLSHNALAGAPSPRRRIAAAQARLAATRADQLRIRAEIGALRDGLALLAGLAPGALDTLPGGPIPLPPSPSPPADRGAPRALRHYAAARRAEDRALARAEYARAVAARKTLRAQAGPPAPAEAIVAGRAAAAAAADCRALNALQAEKDARAAMSQAYVALVKASTQ